MRGSTLNHGVGLRHGEQNAGTPGSTLLNTAVSNDGAKGSAISFGQANSMGLTSLHHSHLVSHTTMGLSAEVVATVRDYVELLIRQSIGGGDRVVVKRLKTTVLEGFKAVTNKALSIYSLELTREDLQALIAGRFPIRKGDRVTVTLKDPVVRLDEGNDRIGIELTVSAGLIRQTALDSRWLVDGELSYDRDRAEFFLNDPDVRSLEPAREPDSPGPLRRLVVKAILARTLSKFPIYRLKETATGHSLARILLKSVRVRNGKLLIEFGLY